MTGGGGEKGERAAPYVVAEDDRAAAEGWLERHWPEANWPGSPERGYLAELVARVRHEGREAANETSPDLCAGHAETWWCGRPALPELNDAEENACVACRYMAALTDTHLAICDAVADLKVKRDGGPAKHKRIRRAIEALMTERPEVKCDTDPHTAGCPCFDCLDGTTAVQL